LLDVNFQSYPYYIITEHVSGIDLKTLMQNIGALPMHSAKRLLLIIGDVMNSLKVKKFPYSGIRPSKILIDHELEPEISPFDILAVNRDKRLLKSFEEDAFYFSNEILFDAPKPSEKENTPLSPDATDRANQFCLAALGYEMITGEKLFSGKNIADILMMRNRFFTDADYRKKRLEHPRLPKRMVTIFKKMLNADPYKRYDDIPTALKEIASVRVVMSDNEEKVFKSYRRCLNNTDDFMAAFYTNLFAHPDMQAQKPDAKDTETIRALQQKFYIDINMVFGVENFGNFVEKMATMEHGEINPLSEYTIFLDAFIKTVAECDPRWDNSKEIGKAWMAVRESALEQLKATFPEPETVSNHIPETVLNTVNLEKEGDEGKESMPNVVEPPQTETGTTKMDTTMDNDKA
jgi:serine/threonine protein kinase